MVKNGKYKSVNFCINMDGNMKIMIIDDSKTARMFTKKCAKSYFSSVDLEFIEEENGETAFKKLHDEKVDIILSDVNMPVMNGFTLMRNLKMDDDLSGIPVVFITSLANKARIDNLLMLGASGVISKPIKSKEFAVILDKMNLKANKTETEDDGGWG